MDSKYRLFRIMDIIVVNNGLVTIIHGMNVCHGIVITTVHLIVV